MNNALRRVYAGIPGARQTLLGLRILKSRLFPQTWLFREAYLKRSWGSRESVSGLGSTYDSTANLRIELPVFWRAAGIRRLVDVPCGDFHWMRTIAHELDSYVGIDIVGDLIERNRARYETPKVRFCTGSITKG